MKKLIALSLLVSTVASAEINLDVHVVIADQELKKRCVFNEETQVYFAEQDALRVEATAVCEQDEVVTNFKVFVKNEQGEQLLVMEPVLRAEFDHEACIVIGNEAGDMVASVAVTATK